MKDRAEIALETAPSLRAPGHNLPKRAMAVALVATVAIPSPVWSGGKRLPETPALTREHVHPSGLFSFRTPGDWTVEVSGSDPDALQASGGGVLVRFLYRHGESGYDSLHATCMAERLAGPMETDAQVKYEYDFTEGAIGNRRALDSAFAVRYDRPILGHRDWRQRNLTIVGDGQSLCVITYAPVKVWRGSAASRGLLDAIVGSLTFRSGP